MAGTIIITGGNGSLAVNLVQQLLTRSPATTLILTVRNTSDEDPNTKNLRATLAKFPTAKTSIRQLDLASLAAVHDFAGTIAAEVGEQELPPLASIVCSAFYWNLNSEPEHSDEGYEKSLQVNHISHAALVLRLLGSFGSQDGRVVLFTSDGHDDGKNGLQKYPPGLPDDLDSLLKATPSNDNFGHGFLRYANSKLAILMWGYALNRHLEKDASLSKITVMMEDPGSLVDSRALRTNTPAFLGYVQRFVLSPLRPVLRLRDPYMRTCAEAGADLADLALNRVLTGERGYLKLLKQDASSKDSLDEVKQEELWSKTAEWAKVTNDNTAFQSSI